MASEIENGFIADLSIFSDDPALEIFNPTILRMMTHHGRLFGVPVYAMPWGIYVNRSLAENANLDVPDPNWTLDEFIFFSANHRRDEWYGGMGIPWVLMDTGTPDFFYNLLWREDGDPYVRMDTPAIREILSIAPRVMWHSLHTNRAAGNISPAFLSHYAGTDGGNVDRWRLFSHGRLLTHYHDPNRMTVAGSSVHPNRVQIREWDYFPRPSTEWVGNHLGNIIEPFGIRNFAMLDGDAALSQYELERLQLAWEFVRFFSLDRRSWNARADFTFGEYGLSALNEGFPFVVGQLYWDIMDLYFLAEERQIFGNTNRFPGFHYVMDLWQAGQFWALWSNVFPLRHMHGTTNRLIYHEWQEKHSRSVVGAHETDLNWYDQIMVHLPNWDTLFNERWEDRFAQIYENMQRFYVPVR